MFKYCEILLTLNIIYFLGIVNFSTISCRVYVADFERVNVCWAIFSCSPEKDEVVKTIDIDDRTKQLLKARNISLC